MKSAIERNTAEFIEEGRKRGFLLVDQGDKSSSLLIFDLSECNVACKQDVKSVMAMLRLANENTKTGSLRPIVFLNMVARIDSLDKSLVLFEQDRNVAPDDIDGYLSLKDWLVKKGCKLAEFKLF